MGGENMNVTINKGSLIQFTYKNWKGETSERKALVGDFTFGSNEYHTEPQFLMIGFDVDKMQYRTFATRDMKNIRTFNV
jgi:hypothetical protein